MKKLRHIIYLPLLSAAMLSWSCDDMLDLKVTSQYGDDITWSVYDIALGVLNQGYSGLPQFACSSYSNTNFSDAITDNAMTIDWDSTLNTYVAGGVSASSDPLSAWSTNYTKIAAMNLFMENGLGDNISYDLFDEDVDEAMRTRSKGEAYFFRAWYGHKQLRLYGGEGENGEMLGFPILTSTLDYSEDRESADLPRNTYEECVAQIIADCDVAIECLPLTYDGTVEVIGATEQGRVSRKAAYALRSRVALMGASPAYQPSSITDEELESRWLRAATAAYEAIEGCHITTIKQFENYMIVGTVVQNIIPDEILFSRWSNSNGYENHHLPPMIYGQGKTNPSQDLVDAFPTTDGYPITDSRSLYDPQNPYENRDLRFYETIDYNDKDMRNEIDDLDGESERKFEIYTTEGGVLGRDVEGYHRDNSVTGYYLRKGVSSTANFLYDATQSVPTTKKTDYHLNPMLRGAELFYNLAEALNELVGADGTVDGIGYTAFDIISSFRRVNGITSDEYLIEVADNKDEFLALLLNERRIEFAFEDMRLWDIRRHKLPLDVPIRGVKVTKMNSGEFSYEYPETNIQERLLSDEKFYTSPIPNSEMLMNPNMIQNKGW